MTIRTARHLPAKRGEEGMVTAFVVIFAFALILVAGLVVDGGLTLAARIQAVDEAQAAARTGAQQINLALFRSDGQVVLDPARATQAAQAYLSATGHSGTVVVDGDQVQVAVRITQPMQILDLAGIDHLTVVGHGAATADEGVTAPQNGAAP